MRFSCRLQWKMLMYQHIATGIWQPVKATKASTNETLACDPDDIVLACLSSPSEDSNCSSRVIQSREQLCRSSQAQQLFSPVQIGLLTGMAVSILPASRCQRLHRLTPRTEPD